MILKLFQLIKYRFTPSFCLKFMTRPDMNTQIFFFFSLLFVCSIRSAFNSDTSLSHFVKQRADKCACDS